MKRIAVAVCAAVLITSGALIADAKKAQKSEKPKTKIALKLEGKVSKELVPTSQKDVPGVGTDYTFEWSGGHGNILIFADSY